VFPYRTEPRKHQREWFERTRDLPARGDLSEMGCVDGATEFLSPVGWKRIDLWQGEMIAQWNQDTGEAEFVRPSGYRVAHCREAYRFAGRSIPTQVLTPDHRMPLLPEGEALATDVVIRLRRHAKAYFRLPSRWTMPVLPGKGLGLSAEQIRVQVAVMADGSFPREAPHTKRCVVRLKKRRKIDRLRTLLEEAGIQRKERIEEKTGFVVFAFNAPQRQKRIASWWPDISAADRDVIRDEVFRWDGSAAKNGRGERFFSVHERDADFIQFVAASSGDVARKTFSAGLWTVSLRGTRTNGYVVTSKNVSEVVPDGERAYCFTVPSGFFVARRDGGVFPTGNTGKTKVVVDTAAWLFYAGKIRGLLVLAPPSVAPNWTTLEVPTHMPDSVPVRSFLYLSPRAGTRKFQRELAAFLAAPDGLAVLAMSYDAMMTEGGRIAAWNLLRSRPCLYVLDECQAIKNPSTQRAKRVLKSGAYAPVRRILTGTPIADKPFDAYAPVRFLDPLFWRPIGVSTFAGFRSLFGRFVPVSLGQGRSFNKLVGYRNLDLLRDQLARISHRVLKKDVLDLPPKSYTTRFFELPPEGRRRYDLVEDGVLDTLDDVASTTTGNVIQLRRAACGIYPGGDEMEVTPARAARLELLREVVDDALESSPDRGVIVWASWPADVATICAILEAAGVKTSRMDGSVPQADRPGEVAKFQAGETRVFVGNPQVGGSGLTLTRATTVVYYSCGYSLVERLQSEDRAHRIGQTNPVMYVDLVALNTIDEKVTAALVKKDEVARIVTADGLREWIQQRRRPRAVVDDF